MTDPRPRPDAQPHPEWRDRYDDEAGPLVRLYAMTAGRARTDNGAERVDLMAIVHPTGTRPAPHLPPEQTELTELCARGPRPVADLASDSGLPLGVVRVLLGDLVAHGLVRITPPATTGHQARPHADLLREVIHGLRAL